WVAEERGETPDPAIHYGELANGLRYAVMRSAEPKGVAVVEYHIAVGTAQQSANEKEFAHLVEHMAFGATTTFPKGDAIAQLQSAGLQLGGDVNGATSARGTVYSLSIPQVTTEKLALALRFLRGFSDGALFDANEVERQKGVVGAEIAGGETQATRAARALRQQFYPELP
ncbi:M16 family metallopeptidase, partial [Pseudomonas sp. RA_35y_Pfl2_P32]